MKTEEEKNNCRGCTVLLRELITQITQLRRSINALREEIKEGR